jgi:hypothetical protein
MTIEGAFPSLHSDGLAITIPPTSAIMTASLHREICSIREQTLESAGPAPSDALPTLPATLPVPLPPIGVDQPAEPHEPGEMLVVEANPALLAALRESYTAKNAISGTKTDTPHSNRETTSTT